MAADGKPRITWHGKDFAATTEIVRLGDVEIAVRVPDLPDPWSRRFIAGMVAFERVERAANHLAPAHLLEMAACRWLEKGGTVETWREYEIVLGVTKSKTRPPGSLIQPFIKWARGGRNDTDGSLHRLSSAFDAWLAQKDRPDPYPRNGEPGTSVLAKWLVDEHGYQAVAKAHDARLEYQAALKRGAVWVTCADGTERVYDSKVAAESQNEGPAYEEPAEWWDLEGFEPIGPGEYRRIDPETDDDPLPERVKGEVRPEFHHRPDDQNYSESNSENALPFEHVPDRGAVNARKSNPAACGHQQRKNAFSILSDLGKTNCAREELFVGDCLEVLAIQKDASVNLIMTSPPYADARKSAYGGIPADRYVEWWLERAEQFRRVLTRDGSLIVNIKEGCEDRERSTYVLELILAMRRAGWFWTEEYIWHKSNSVPGKWPTRFRDAWERCLHFTLDRDFAMYQDAVRVPLGDWAKTRLANPSEADMIRDQSASGSGFGRNISNWSGRDLVYPSNVLHFATECSVVEHPAPFPQALPEFFIKLFTRHGNLVCDPFMGSGTTGVVCARLNRRFIGVDILEEYARLAERRISGARWSAAAN